MTDPDRHELEKTKEAILMFSPQAVSPLATIGNNLALAEPRKTLGKEDFLRLLAVQLTHQDPLEPMANTEFIAQLAEFSSLEQLQNANGNLETMAILTQSLNNAYAINLVGKQVKVIGDQITLSGEAPVSIAYAISENAQVTVNIYDANDRLVRTLTAGSQSQGDNMITWDGKNDTGESLPEGEYRFEVNAVRADDTRVDATEYSLGYIRAIRFIDGVPILVMGDRQVSMAEIVEITESSGS
jgi:flagellar basal-body rod modification protein FlgD